MSIKFEIFALCKLFNDLWIFMNIVSKIPYGIHGDTNKRASDANYDPVQMDMSEVQWNWMFAHVCL